MKPTDISAQAVGIACRCVCGSIEPRGHEKHADLARRSFLRNAIAGTAVVLAGATVIPALPASAQSTLTPEAALKALMDGNQRYVAGQLQSLNDDLSILKAKQSRSRSRLPRFYPARTRGCRWSLSSTRASAKSSSSV